MNHIEIKYFKAFRDAIDIPLENNENLFIYGENGSGKSSIYEALKYFFFKDNIEAKKIPMSALIGEGAQGEKDTLRNSYNNKFENKSFELKINNQDLNDLINNNQYENFISRYEILMLSQNEISNYETVDLEKEILKLYTTLNNSSFILTQEECQELEDSINDILENFLEDVRIKIPEEKSEEGERLCILTDTSRNLERTDNFSLYFNEARLNIVKLLLYFYLFQQKTKNSSNKRLLILDDIVTSLDFANRTFLIRYIFDNFSASNDQIILLTHNTSFYNLSCHYINNYTALKDKTKKLHLYQIQSDNKCYVISNSDSVSDIERRYRENPDLNGSIGNDLRKKFESLVHQFSLLLSVGQIEENKDLLKKLFENNPFYLKESKKDVYKLIDSILASLDQNTNIDTLKESIRSQISHYRVDPNDIHIMQSSLSNLKLYLKTTMHPMSHYSGVNQVNITDKEVKITISLMRELEVCISKMQSTTMIEN